jgi:nitric oxide reductase subunit C
MAWTDVCGRREKACLLVVLAACFVGQTTLVYSDPTATQRMDAPARRGREVWHREGCGSCHRLYGMGGYLGPDLTNAASRVPEARIRVLLEWGQGQMPALHLPEGEVADVLAFLRFMDTTGRGEPRPGEEGTWWEYR